MPITINQNKVKFKHPTQQGFITFNTVASETSQQLVAALQQKADAIKGTDWPSEAIEVNNSVQEITNKVNNLVKFQDTAPSTSSTTQVWVDTSSSAEQVGIPTLEDIALVFNESVVYTAGQYVWHDEHLYKFITDHAAGSWTGTDVVQVSLGNDLGNQVSDLKSAISEQTYNIITGKIANALVTSNGQVQSHVDYDVYYAPVTQGTSYTVKTGANLICGFYADEPVKGSISYNNQRIIQSSTTITAPITGYIAVRFSKSYQYPQIVEGTEDKEYITPLTATDNVARLEIENTEESVNQIGDLIKQFREEETKVITGNAIIQNWVPGYYETSSSITNVDVNTIHSNSAWVCTYMSCQENDVFLYVGYGSSSARPWAFLKANGDIIPNSKGAAGSYENPTMIVAPPESATVIFNTSSNVKHYVIVGKLLANRVSDIEAKTDENKADIASIERTLNTLFDNKTASGTGELIEEFSQITGATITDATSAVIRNVQIFEAKYPGATSQYGVNITKNSDGTYTFDGLATASAWFYLNQTSRTGTENVVTLNGIYSARGRVVSGSWQNVTYEGATSGMVAVRKSTDSDTLCALVIGEREEASFEVESDTNVIIGFRLTQGVRYNNLRIEISVNKGNKLFPTVQYIAPTTISSFTNVANVVKNYTPYIWIQTTPNTASISVSGTILKSDEPDEKPNTSLYGILEKYNNRVDILTQMFLKPLFLVYTDIHGNDTNLKRIDTWYKNNKPVYVSDIYCLGDMVKDQASDPITQFDETTIWAKTLRVIGNHDVLASSTIPGITAVAAYEKYIAPSVSNWGVIQPADAATYGKNYYYKDYANKVRVIVLDTYFYTTDQHSWFVNTLENARTNNLAIIVAEHEDICTASEKQPLNADYPFARKYDGYTGLQYRTYGDGGNYETKRAAVDTFIGNGGTFICWLVGHQHADMTGTYNGGTNGKQLSVNLSNASNSMVSSTRINNYSQDCFTYLGVDTETHYLYLLRIGEAVDKWFHQNLFLCYDYVNHIVVEYH